MATEKQVYAGEVTLLVSQALDHIREGDSFSAVLGRLIDAAGLIAAADDCLPCDTGRFSLHKIGE